MNKTYSRKPISNFFIKKELQISLIIKIVLSVLIATVVCLTTLLLTYLIQYKSAVFYRVTFEASASIGERENITSIILPSLLISSIINVVIAAGIGFYASRKYAVPIFKLEQWAKLLQNGQMTAQLHFREKEEFKQLCDSCNRLTEDLRNKLLNIESCTKELAKSGKKSESVETIRQILNSMVLESETIEVHTSYLRTGDVSEGYKLDSDD